MLAMRVTMRFPLESQSPANTARTPVGQSTSSHSSNPENESVHSGFVAQVAVTLIGVPQVQVAGTPTDQMPAELKVWTVIADPTRRPLHIGLSYVIDVLPDPAEHAEDDQALKYEPHGLGPS